MITGEQYREVVTMIAYACPEDIGLAPDHGLCKEEHEPCYRCWLRAVRRASVAELDAAVAVKFGAPASEQ